MKNLLAIIVLMTFVLSFTGCSNQVVKTVYIKPDFEIPVEPTYYSVDWTKIEDNYCVDKENAKNLLKNYLILRTYNQELKKLLLDIKNIRGGADGRTHLRND